MIRGIILSTILLILFPLLVQAGQRLSEFPIGPGDILQVSVWKDEELSREVLVRPDGKISYPLVGSIQAAGRTIEDIQQVLEKKIQEYVPDTPVTVMLKQLRSSLIYVVGKVERPGSYLMEGKMRVMQALALAGGLTRFADKDKIYILRNVKGEQQAIRFDYSKVSYGLNLENNLILQPNDTVVVP
jgi:polysaccharide export outer membrane protein